MNVKFTSDIGARVVAGEGGLLLGLSINNSYFRDDNNLEDMFSWAREITLDTFIMIPDEPMVHTLRAREGYDDTKARREARLKSNALSNRCDRVLRTLKMNARILRWKDINRHPAYIDALTNIRTAYTSDHNLKNAVQTVVAQILKTTTQDDRIDDAAEFIFKEYAFISYADSILDCTPVAYVYHKEMPVLNNILAGQYAFMASDQCGYIIAEATQG